MMQTTCTHHLLDLPASGPVQCHRDLPCNKLDAVEPNVDVDEAEDEATGDVAIEVAAGVGVVAHSNTITLNLPQVVALSNTTPSYLPWTRPKVQCLSVSSTPR